MKQPLRHARGLLLIAVAAFWVTANPERPSAASPTCNDICDELESCDTWCDTGTGSDVTCGEFNGGSSNGMCIGYCGDGYCNSSNNETPETCSSDCTTICQPAWVTTFEYPRGAWEKNWFFYCERWEDWGVRQHDVNGCQPDREICDPRLTDRIYGFDVDCCPSWDFLCQIGAVC